MILKNIILSTSDIEGGAASAAYRLHTGLRIIGHDSIMFVKNRCSNDSTIMSFTPPMNLSARLHRSLIREKINRCFANYQDPCTAGFELFSDDRSEDSATVIKQLPTCNIINLHWVARFIDLKALFRFVNRNTSIIWTLHDMNLFTGGCHYDFGCGRYKDRCGSCPQLGSNDLNDFSHKIWRRKWKILNNLEPERLHIVTPSQWLAEEVKNSTLMRDFPVSVFPNSVNTDIFKPRDSSIAREALEVPQDAQVILFVSASAQNRRKGLALLEESLSGLENFNNLFLISVGDGKPTISKTIQHLHLGYISNERLLSLIYNAADLFIIPSLQDNLPNTVMEAMACGTPIIGFNVGGIPEMVRDEINGILVPRGDVNMLTSTIITLLKDSEKRKEMSKNCRIDAINKYSLKKQAENYSMLFQKVYKDH